MCHAKDAGFIQFDGLFRSIKTGCTATPAFKSQYCTQHMNQACALLHTEETDEELDAITGPTLRSHQFKKQVARGPGDPVAEKILAKRTTRKRTYYQVFD